MTEQQPLRRSTRVAASQKKREATEPEQPAAKPTVKRTKTNENASTTPKLSVGDELPQVTLKDHEGNDVDIKKEIASGVAVIFGKYFSY